MFLPLIIAILLGLVNPANHNTNCNGGGTVYVNSDGSNSGDDGSGSGGDEGSGGDDGTNPGGLPQVTGLVALQEITDSCLLQNHNKDKRGSGCYPFSIQINFN